MSKKHRRKKSKKDEDVIIEIENAEEKIKKYKEKLKKEKNKEEKKSQINEIELEEVSEKKEEEKKDKEKSEEEYIQIKKSELEVIKKELESYKDALLRMKAEFDNYRKRILKEKEQIKKMALEDFFKDLCPILDSFEHAIKSMQSAQDVKSVKEGVELIFKHLVETLKKYEFERIEAVGKKFDPNYHHATSLEEKEGNEEGEFVIEEYQAGYMYAGKVLKPSLVKVAKVRKKTE